MRIQCAISVPVCRAPSRLRAPSIRQLAERRALTSQAGTDVPILHDTSLESLRNAFSAARPVRLRQGTFGSIPAASKWFIKLRGATDGDIARLNAEYLQKYGDVIVPVEITATGTHSGSEDASALAGDKSQQESFTRTETTLDMFLQYMHNAESFTPEERQTSATIYLAQCPISALGDGLQQDLPTPDIVLKAGRGDVYDSSIWMGFPPTFTPLHRDPNPNLFVQLAGTKVIRLFAPDIGNELFRLVQTQLGRSGSAAIRGEEMMHGPEKTLLRDLVWGKEMFQWGHVDAFEATLGPGDGVFIPQGWWHSVVGRGNGVVGSVNWWFR